VKACQRRHLDVKKLLALAAVVGGALLVARKKSAAKAEADLWREATAPAAAPTNNGTTK
jgi:hypothetical protein